MSAASVTAYEPPEPNDWVRPVSLGVTGTLVVWCFCGWIIDKGWTLEGVLLAVLTGVFQCLGFNASAQMRRAAAKRRHRAKKFWAYVLTVTAGWTAFAAHHAYTKIAGDPPPFVPTLDGLLALLQSSAALVLLAAAATIDPLLGWAIEEVERAPTVVPKTAPDGDEDSFGTTKRPPRGSQPKLVKEGAKVATGAAVALELLSMGQTAHATPISSQDQPAGHSQTLAQTVRPWADLSEAERDVARAGARRRLASGEKPGPVSRATGVPLSSCKRYAAELVAEAA